MSQLQLLLWMFFVVWIANCDTSNRYLFSADPPDHPNLDVQMIRNTENKSYDPLVHSKPPSPKNHIQRFRRAAPTDNIQQLLEKSSILAHIANGITLQADIMKGSIQVFKVLPELLNFGDVSYDDVKNFNAAHVNTLAEKLKGLPTSVDDSVKKLEDSTLAWNRRRIESETIESGLKQSKVEGYFTALKTFNASSVFNSITLTHTRLKATIENLEQIERLEIDSSPESKKIAVTEFQQFHSRFTQAIGELKNLSPLKSELLKYEILMEGQTIFAPIRIAINFIVDRMKFYESSNTMNIAQIKKNFQQVDELKIVFDYCINSITMLTKLAENRQSKNKKGNSETSGFIHGISDVAKLETEISGTWFREITHKKVPLERLSNSLQPLFDLASNISDIDERLKPAATADAFESMRQMKKLEAAVFAASNDSQSLAEFLRTIQNCVNKGASITSSNYETSQNAIEKIDSVGIVVAALRKSLENGDPDQQQTEFDNFMTFLGFQNIEEPKSSREEVSEVMTRIKNEDNFDKFKKGVIDMANGFNIDNLDELEKNITEILSAENKTTFDGLTEELSIYECLRAHKDKMEQIATAIETTKTLREVETADVQNVETWAKAVASVSRDLNSLLGRPSDMKSSAPPETNELNSFPFPPKVDDTIITSVNYLRSALELKKMKNSISVLESVGSVVEKEMNAITDPNEKKEVEDGWGNHTRDISSLEAMVASIEDFDKSLNLSGIKTIKGYGAQIAKLEKLPSVNIDSKRKIKVLDYLIFKSNDPIVNSELVKSKEIFEKIDSLDLDFASKKSILHGASAAFNDFNNFLIGLSSALQIPPSSVQQPAPINAFRGEETTKAPDYYLIFGVGGGSVAGAVFVGVATWLIYKKIKITLLKRSLRKWLRRQIFETVDDARECHQAYMVEIEKHTVKKDMIKDYVPQTKSRSPTVYCNPETALKHIKLNGKEMPIHANLITAEDGTRFYVTQLPFAKKKLEDNQEATCEEFWHMCMHENVKSIISLCTTGELHNVYFEEKMGQATHGRYEVWSQKDYLKDEFIRVRRIQVVDLQGTYRKRWIRVYCLSKWEELGLPSKDAWQDVRWMLKMAMKKKFLHRPIVVHSRLGIGRAMSVIAVHTISEAVKRNPKTNLTDELLKLRAARWGSFQSFEQTYWIQVAVCQKLNEDYNLGMRRACRDMHEMYTEVVTKKEDKDKNPKPKKSADEKKGNNNDQADEKKGNNYDQTKPPVIANSIRSDNQTKKPVNSLRSEPWSMGSQRDD
ncbi:hypothetical protein CAEBREN_14510 [Caenorhabditis brenneri]|uniref:Tyrosine-protein phosphatase domain-containing protein n=1 Tax=Caenorhabditis brenneri TaxID=135651 RepID=G0MZV4_CAEBE|nr:hypothetical protein CAEBREN_14510 [Caenorhabditis brenneri]